MTDQIKKKQSWWRSLRTLVYSAVVAASGLLAYLLGVDYAKLKEISNSARLGLINLLQGEDLNVLSGKQVFHLPANDSDVEVMVEIVASKRGLRGCEADLDIGANHEYSRVPDSTPDGDAASSLKRFRFIVAKKEYPEHASVRLHCGEFVTNPRTEIDWKVDDNKQNFAVVVGDNDSHGGPSIGCIPNAEDWAKLAHPDVCKFVKSVVTGSTDGGRCRPECGWNSEWRIPGNTKLSFQAARSIG
jgi:hypothetical protein